jgi:hypothetical protein
MATVFALRRDHSLGTLHWQDASGAPRSCGRGRSDALICRFCRETHFWRQNGCVSADRHSVAGESTALARSYALCRPPKFVSRMAATELASMATVGILIRTPVSRTGSADILKSDRGSLGTLIAEQAEPMFRSRFDPSELDGHFLQGTFTISDARLASRKNLSPVARRRRGFCTRP